MIVTCPHCGNPVVVNGLGRKRLNIPLKNVYNALQLQRNVVTAANELGCSRAYVYQVLKANGMTPAEVIKGYATKGNLPAH